MSSSTSSSDIRAFCLQVVAWVIALCAFGAANAAINHQLMRYHRGEGIEEARTLLLGDSHAASGLDPAFWTEALNYGLSGEPVAATYFKVKYLAAGSPNLERIVLSLGPHSIAPFNEALRSGEFTTNFLMESLFGIVPLEVVGGVDLSLETAFSVKLRTWWSPNVHLVGDLVAHALGNEAGRGHPDFEGYHAGRRTGDLSEERFKMVMERHFPSNLTGVSTVQEAYLDSILGWAEESDVEVVIIGTPLHERYRAAVPDEINAALTALWSRLESEGVTMLDFSEFPIPDSMFFDFDHVNSMGAEAIGALITESLAGSEIPLSGS